MLSAHLIVALAMVVTLGAVAAASSPYTFLGIGDWGGAALGEPYTTNVYAVANQLALTATATDAKFILGVGDNFYWCGIQNSTDPLITTDWVNPYSNASLNLQWYSTLGNHEYGYNVDAQIDYYKMNPKWYMPSRYYFTRIQLDTTHYMTMIVLDTTPCVSGYRGTNTAKYDPCSSEYPTCSLFDTDDDFTGPCHFHDNVLSQDCSLQYTWLQDVLKNHVPAEDWLVIVGHHPLDELDVVDFTSLVQKHGFSMYINGHTHLLNYYTIDGAGAYVTTGAGAMVDTPDQSHEVTKRKRAGERTTTHILDKLTGALTATHTSDIVYQDIVAGFTAHSFNSEFTRLETNFITYSGEVVYTLTLAVDMLLLLAAAALGFGTFFVVLWRKFYRKSEYSLIK